MTEVEIRMILIRINTYLAPVVSAYYVGQALAAPLPVKLAAGIAVELTGLAANQTAVKLWQWNREHPEQPAPLGLAVAAVSFQLIVSCSLAVGLALQPELQPWAPVGFALLALVAYSTGAMLLAQEQRELALARGIELSKSSKRFWKVVRERPLSREQGEIALLEAGGDPVAALKLLPEPVAQRLPNSASKPQVTRSPSPMSEPLYQSSPNPIRKPIAIRQPNSTSQPIAQLSAKNASDLICPKCLSPTDKSGRPWLSPAAMRGHQAYCKGVSPERNGHG